MRLAFFMLNGGNKTSQLEPESIAEPCCEHTEASGWRGPGSRVPLGRCPLSWAHSRRGGHQGVRAPRPSPLQTQNLPGTAVCVTGARRCLANTAAFRVCLLLQEPHQQLGLSCLREGCLLPQKPLTMVPRWSLGSCLLGAQGDARKRGSRKRG